MAVYNELRPGFLEGVYHEAMEIELRERSIPFASYVPLTITYMGQKLNKHYVADIVAYDQIVVELKALNRLTSIEEAQLLNFLKVTGYRLGLLINFGRQPDLEWKRMIK
jgi:GxxExxY protein